MLMQSEFRSTAFINGEAVDREQRIKRENPANPEEIVGSVPECTRADAKMAIEKADEAFQSWSRLSLDERLQYVMAGLAKVGEKGGELAPLLAREHGKVVTDAFGEMMFAAILVQQNAEMIRQFEFERVHEDELGKMVSRRVPYGVVSAITPWNYPIVLAFGKIAPALVTGNTMVLKPSPFAPLAVSELVQAFAKELPKGVLNVLHGGPEVGEEMTTHAKVAKISFTGGVPTASAIMRSAAAGIKKVTFELGGNDPAIFLEDADLSDRSMLKLVVGTFLTTGQICMAAKRIYVHESIYERFLEAYIAKCNEWIKIGDPLADGVTMGPLNNLNQKKYVQALVEDAKSRGAKVVEVGQVLDKDAFARGYFLKPTVVTNVDHSFRIVREEQFGPTVPVMPFKSEEEVIRLANDTDLGLGSSVWSADRERAIRLARQIEAGYTFINTHSLGGLDLRAPFGGCKKSGIGVEGGMEVFMDYTRTHVINAPNDGLLPGIE
jgi:acyl-CoA reductase-like NAD-dependent aldehyde dehydrogenase